MLKLVDSHCHIPMLEDIEFTEIMDNARAAGVTHMLCVSVDLDSFPEVLATSERHESIYASVGIHPNTEMETEVSSEQLVSLADHPKVIGIGETGLDYFRSEGDLDWQRDRFRTHIQAAKETAKPLIIHSREAKEDTINILREEAADSVGGVMHCFVEDWETAQRAMELNFYISFSGIVTFKNAQDLQEVAKKVPLEKMLVETDSPYLAPVPKRGKQNQPAYVRHVAEFLAELKSVSYEQIANQTSINFSSLFNVIIDNKIK